MYSKQDKKIAQSQRRLRSFSVELFGERGIDRSNVEMAELVDYFNKQTAQQKYNDYDGVPITASMISKLKSLIKP